MLPTRTVALSFTAMLGAVLLICQPGSVRCTLGGLGLFQCGPELWAEWRGRQSATRSRNLKGSLIIGLSQPVSFGGCLSLVVLEASARRLRYMLPVQMKWMVISGEIYLSMEPGWRRGL